jgi:dTMP kinase
LQNQSVQIPVSVEEKIVNDAFILGSLGAIGLVRFFTWYESSSLNPNGLLKINNLFKERFNKIVTSQGLNLAEKENKFIYLFSAILQQEPLVESSYPGKYIVLEGNSGTGKNKQAELLKAYFEKKGMTVTVVQEPTQVYRDFETYIESKTKFDLADSAPIFRLYSIIGDRHNQIHDKVLPALVDGNIVISIRSYISMLVYQCENEFDRLYVNFLHRFVPRPDIVILYDTIEEICLQRVLGRGTKMTPFDKFENLKRFRPIYLDIVKSNYFDFPLEIVDASGTVEQVAADTIKVIAKYI